MTNHINQTEMNDNTTPATGERERRAMDNPTTTPRRGPGRKLLAAGAAMGAVALFASAAAWACTLRDGTTLDVWNKDKYATCAAAGSASPDACSKASGNASQVGLATVDTAGDTLNIKGTGFVALVDPDFAYSITWRHPGSTGNCHRTNPDGSIVQMGASVDVSLLGAFDVTRTAISTSGRSQQTGLVRLCVQDYEFGTTATVGPTPTVVIGQIVDISVL